jgi:hypothetical protein
LEDLGETGTFLVVVRQHAQGDVLPFGMECFGVVEFGFARVELLDFCEELLFGFDFLEKLVAGEHLVQDQACAPDVAFFVVRSQVDDFGGSVERSAGAFGHLYLNVSGQAKVCNFKLLIFIKEYVIRLEVPVHLI